MFTGIITGIGTIESIVDAGDRSFRIDSDWDCAAIDIGASIACSGVCLTVVQRDANSFLVTASAETLGVTTAVNWAVGDLINLERALKLGDELGGHLVSGHVDGLAEIKSIETSGDSHIVWLQAPADLAKFIAAKGSIALDGVSLTVNAVDGCLFHLNIIPHTWSVTGWARSAVGQKMNMEIDMLARYVARLSDFSKE
jgi:riboflavin synthase